MSLLTLPALLPPLLPTNLCEGDFLVSVYIALIWHSVPQTSCSRAAIWLRKITTDSHILAHVNISCPDDWHPELKMNKYSKSKFSQNTTNLLSIKVATCFDSRSHHKANYWIMFEVHQVKVHIFGIQKCSQQWENVGTFSHRCKQNVVNILLTKLQHYNVLTTFVNILLPKMFIQQWEDVGTFSHCCKKNVVNILQHFAYNSERTYPRSVTVVNILESQRCALSLDVPHTWFNNWPDESKHVATVMDNKLVVFWLKITPGILSENTSRWFQ